MVRQFALLGGRDSFTTEGSRQAWSDYSSNESVPYPCTCVSIYRNSYAGYWQERGITRGSCEWRFYTSVFPSAINKRYFMTNPSAFKHFTSTYTLSQTHHQSTHSTSTNTPRGQNCQHKHSTRTHKYFKMIRIDPNINKPSEP